MQQPNHADRNIRAKIELRGIVQGVGMRPFVLRLAREMDLTGHVFNHSLGVTAEAQGRRQSVIESFVARIKHEAPAAARVETVDVEWINPLPGEKLFEILKSPVARAGDFVPVSPDLALCDNCRHELHDCSNRRYGYPFINCTDCGPRFTIIKGIPYDRPLTTMAAFNMCDRCKAEYDNPADRRFHAQPNACPDCGPRAWLADKTGKRIESAGFNLEAIENCAAHLREGGIAAVKGLGGFHLCCDAMNEMAVSTLRSRKLREDKPFAVMFQNMASLRNYARTSNQDEKILLSRHAPIVLLEKARALAPSVAPANRYIGALLPYTPLHELLLTRLEKPLVVTSGNMSDEPIAFTDTDALERLGRIADYFLLHDRDIHMRCDDSVVQSAAKPFFVRRSRGYAPEGIALAPQPADGILGTGALLKNTFCITRGGSAWPSHHIGDLDNVPTLESFEHGISHFARLLNTSIKVVAHDLHPGYPGTKWALRSNARTIAVQHHHAHIAACLAENNHSGPVVGIALDGTGLGTDGTIWGGEILVADLRDFFRVAHLRAAPLPGGDSAVKHPWKTALAYFGDAIGIENALALPALSALPAGDAAVVAAMIRKKLNCPVTTSCGRLFDALSAALGIIRETNYEGQAAIELERAIITGPGPCGYSFNIEKDEIDWRPALISAAHDIKRGRPAGLISHDFHEGLAGAVAASAIAVARRYGIGTIAMSGGCFMNLFLQNRIRAAIKEAGLNSLGHSLVPANDGGISLGQVVVADNISKETKSCVSQYR